MSQERIVRIKKDHPSLSGHFPGNPVVPGVIILEEVLETIRQDELLAITITGAPSIKFHSPLRPEEDMTIHLEPYQSQGRRFSCQSGPRLIASGFLTYQRGKPAAEKHQ